MLFFLFFYVISTYNYLIPFFIEINMFNSKVYLIRSEEYLEEDFSQVVNLLNQFNGPIEFISAETNYLQSTLQ